MPSLEMKARNRKKGRSHLHVSSIPPPSTTSPNPSSPDSLNPTNSTQPSSSSSDERKSPDSISSSSLFDDEQWKRSIRLRQRMGLKDTVWWGYCLLGMTWLMFILGMGGVCGVWEWSLKPIRSTKTRMVMKGDEPLAMSGYYSSLMVLTGAVVAWIWVVLNWVGMKYFRHN